MGGGGYLSDIGDTMKTIKQVRESFYDYCQETGLKVYPNKRQNNQPCDTRCAFVDFVDTLCRDGAIDQKLAQRVTL